MVIVDKMCMRIENNNIIYYIFILNDKIIGKQMSAPSSRTEEPSRTPTKSPSFDPTIHPIFIEPTSAPQCMELQYMQYMEFYLYDIYNILLLNVYITNNRSNTKSNQ